GFYQFAELPVGGNSVITPSKANLSFEPPSRTFPSLNADQSTDFVASTCTYTIAPITQSFNAAGGSGSVNVTSLHDCPWTAVSSADWIAITNGSTGSGNGVVDFTVSSTTTPRSGHITIAGKNFAVYQGIDSCGAPSFSAMDYSVPDWPNVVRVADVNGDGRNDIVMANNGSISGGGNLLLSVLINNGGSGFTTSSFESG